MSPRVVLITGCSSGIGKATAVAFHEAGWTVYASARRPETLADLAGLGVQTLALDVLDEDSMTAAVAAVHARYGVLDVLVNNAGYALQMPVEEATMEEVRRQFETNVFGLVRLTQLVLPGMRARHSGRIINVSSMGGRFTLPGGSMYHASKHAVEAISDALRLEVAPFGVKVVVVQPGPVRTEFGGTAVGGLTPSGIDGDTGPYADFKHRLAAAYASAYDGRRPGAASAPRRVAGVIVKASTVRSPRSRYLIGPVARAFVTSRRLLPDKAFDLLLKAGFPTP
ncbi:MAG: SDR family NAD(P)-dependent oxidoreductase [Nocardioidaceae bacterium]|nr:SDR family NAD(P)-dependent oxidoreductase [Nocardioidaceae bacterium]